MEFQNKVVLITGASRGIGRGLALAFAQLGSNVVINYLTHSREAQNVAQKIKESAREAFLIRADVTKRKEVERMVEKILKKFGRIDILVNNAGAVFEPADWMQISEQNWQKTIDVNLTGVFNCIKALAPIMLKQKSGKIINIASLAGITGTVYAPAYSVAKAGVINLTRAFAKELAPFVNVNAVAPGWVKTGWHHLNRHFLKIVKKQVPLQKIAEVEDIVSAVLFLASDKSKHITGQTLVVDGGASL